MKLQSLTEKELEELKRYGRKQTGFYCTYFSSGHLRHDYLIKYAYFSKCYLERFASISAPEK